MEMNITEEEFSQGKLFHHNFFGIIYIMKRITLLFQ